MTQTDSSEVVRVETLPFTLWDEAWEMYEQAFREVDALAAQRHLMTRREFVEVIADKRISLYVRMDGLKIAGLSVMTSDLDAWPLISPAYFRRVFPGRHVFYVGFVAVVAGSPGTYQDLVRRMYDDVIAADGVAVMDFCAYNLQNRRIGPLVNKLLTRINPAARVADIDRQEFWAWDFREPQS